MTKEEFKHIRVGDTLVEGSDHKIVVTRKIPEHEPYIAEYYENGYFHETNCEYLS